MGRSKTTGNTQNTGRAIRIAQTLNNHKVYCHVAQIQRQPRSLPRSLSWSLLRLLASKPWSSGHLLCPVAIIVKRNEAELKRQLHVK